MFNVLLTGAGGFVGKNLLPALRKISDLNVIPIYGKKDHDLTSQEICHRLFGDNEIDIVINLCGRVGGISDNIKYPADYYYQNLITAMNLIHAAKKAKISGNFIQIGSTCCYANKLVDSFTENMLFDGIPESTNAAYAYAKRGQLTMLESYWKQYGLKYQYLIAGNLYGPHDNFSPEQSHVIPAIFNKFLDAKKNNSKSITLFGTGTPIRDFLYIGDLIAVIQRLLFCDLNSTLNISSGKGTSILDVAIMIRTVLNLPEIEIKLDLTKPDGQYKRELDIAKLKNLIDFTPTSLYAGLEKTKDFIFSKEA